MTRFSVRCCDCWEETFLVAVSSAFCWVDYHGSSQIPALSLFGRADLSLEGKIPPPQALSKKKKKKVLVAVLKLKLGDMRDLWVLKGIMGSNSRFRGNGVEGKWKD